MFSKLFPGRHSAAEPNASTPPGERVYAVGDIHGRLDLLEPLLNKILVDDAGRGGNLATIIFLGDLIDRGPESAQVVESLRSFAATRPSARTRFLLGNHEEVFLNVLAGEIPALKFFHRIGGRETILSYGISEAQYDACDYETLMGMVLDRVPAEHGNFLRAFEDMVIVGDYVFVHAGLRPNCSLDRQRPSDLRWIREEFLSHSGPFERIVVHGHTITPTVETTAHRIGLDTGAYHSGTLTAMGFEGASRWVIESGAADR